MNEPPALAKVFISHSHQDRAVATDVQRVLHKHHAETYLDQDRIQAADVLPQRIRDGIQWCSSLVLLWSAHAARSGWVNQEWNTAHHLGKRIIPYCIDSTALPSPIGDLVYVDSRDARVSHAGLLRAVFGRSFVPPSTELFPGTWQITLDAFGFGTASYDLELRVNGQVTGAGRMNPGSALEGVLDYVGMSSLLNIQSKISGAWEYDEQTEILTLDLTGHGLDRRFHETIHIRTTGREQYEITGEDFAGRNYVIKRVTNTRNVLLAARNALKKFIQTEFGSGELQQQVEDLLIALEPYERLSRAQKPQVSTPDVRNSSSLRETLRGLYVGKHGGQLASGVILSKGIAGALLKKIEARLQNPNQTSP